MSRKLTIEEIKKRAKDIGIWEVLDGVYINCGIKLNCKCIAKGHLHKICWFNIQQGRKCPYCAGSKLNIDIIKERAKRLGKWEILSDVYIDNKTNLTCRCVECGYIHKSPWYIIQRGGGCPKCNIEHQKLTIEEVKTRSLRFGIWEILDAVYVNARTKLVCRCIKCGCIHKIDWNGIQQCRGCPVCHNKIRSKLQVLTIEEVKRRSNELGKWIILDNTYVSAHELLNCRCVECGQYHRLSWNAIQQNTGCPECGKITIEKVKDYARKMGIWTVLSDHYEGCGVKLDCVCVKGGHQHKVSWDSIRRNRGCPKCSNMISKWEDEVGSFLNNIDINYESNSRKQLLNPKTNCFLELDVWFPQLNKAIECNGIYWHSMSTKKNNDKIKQRLCKQQGIDLLVITDEEWNKDINKCKTKIKQFVLEG